MTHKLLHAILLWLFGSLFLPAQSAGEDIWKYFRPETVFSTDCRVELVSMYAADGVGKADVYQAIASAKRNLAAGDWEMVILAAPHTYKGRKQAAIACADWSDKAEAKRIQAASASAGWNAKHK